MCLLSFSQVSSLVGGGWSTRCDAIILSLQQMETTSFSGIEVCPNMQAMVSDKAKMHTYVNIHNQKKKKWKEQHKKVKNRSHYLVL